MADKVINIGNSNNKVTVNVTDKIVCPTFDGTATKVGHKLSFGNKTFDGSSTVILSGADLGSVDLTSEQTITGQKTFSGETYLDSLNANTGLISGNLRVVNGIFENLTGNVTGNLSGNASTATKLQTARTLTIGNTGKSFDGSSDISWTLSEIGAASSSHTHSYLPLSGGTITGTLNINRDASAIHYNNSSGVSQGWLGFSAADTPTVWMANGSTKYNLIHSGNIGSQSVSYATSSPAAANYGGRGDTTKIKIKINSTKQWMLSFVVTIYQGYKSSKIMISGYNYQANYWYQPKAVLLGDSSGATSISVYFGYDSASNLWVGFDGGSYTGVSISDVTNGFTQISSYKDLFTISNVSSLNTLQTTITAVNSVNYAMSAGKADTATNVAWSGVTNKPNFINSFGTKTGDITIRGGQTGNGSVNLAMSNNELQASIVGLGSNAYSSTEYLPLAGGTLTGILTLKANQYNGNSGLNANNSDIIGVNSIYTCDTADNTAEGIRFYRDATHWDSLTANGGKLYFMPNDTLSGTAFGSANEVYHTGNLSPMTTSHPANNITKTNIDNWNAVHTWYTIATADDTTNTIDTWKEIEAFVSSFKKGDNLATYLANNYLAKSGGTISGPISLANTNAKLAFGDLSTSPITGYKAPSLLSNGIGIYSRYGGRSDEGAIIITEDTCVIYNSADTGWNFQVMDKDMGTDMTNDATRSFGVNQKHQAFSLGGFVKSGSSDNYVLLGGGGHKAVSDFAVVFQENTTTRNWRKLVLSAQNGASASVISEQTGHVYVNANIECQPSTGTLKSTNLQATSTISAGTTVTAATSITSTAGDIYVGGTSGSRCHIKMDTTNKCIKFIFD